MTTSAHGIKTENLRIKGTRHYSAKEALANNELKTGSVVQLNPEPSNPFDSNAVKVLSQTGKMLGHISRDIAPKFKRLSESDYILKAHIIEAIATHQGDFIITVAVTYQSWKDADVQLIPTNPGCYLISLEGGRSYIGATGNLRRRHTQHIRNLLNHSHKNNLLQADFNRLGLAKLKFEILEQTKSFTEAERIESREIFNRTLNGHHLYNKTIDGKGVQNSNGNSGISITDRPQASVYESPTSLPSSANIAKIETKQTSTQQSESSDNIAKVKIKDGGVFTGVLTNGNSTGDGIVRWPNGLIYEGQIKNGEITGYGSYTWPNGDMLTGEFINGRRVGNGRGHFKRGG